MNYYSVQSEQLTTDWNFLGATKDFEYYNLVQRDSFTYYENPNMLAGILIDIHPDKLVTIRSVYSL
jgi:hypothetical protein